jgi:hypothetical protein
MSKTMVPKLNARQGTTIRDKGGNTYTIFFLKEMAGALPFD